MTTCEYVRDGGMTEPSEKCRREAHYQLTDIDDVDAEEPIQACYSHALELAHENDLTVFVVTDIRGEKQKWEDAEAQALDIQEDSAREDLF